MTNLERIDKKIYYTYHSKKNKEALPIVLFFSVIAIIFNNALLYEMIIWAIYYNYCKKNNEKLNNDPANLEERAFLIKFKHDIQTGKIRYK